MYIYLPHSSAVFMKVEGDIGKVRMVVDQYMLQETICKYLTGGRAINLLISTSFSDIKYAWRMTIASSQRLHK